MKCRVWRTMVVFESAKGREVFLPTASAPEIHARFAAWLARAEARAAEAGVCLAFSVGVHVVGADCDHEVAPC
jgi:hypothetical protein